MDFVLGLGLLLCTAFDTLFTRRRLLKYGIELELNPRMKATAEKRGLDYALLRWIILPNAVLTIVGVGFHWTIFLALFLGCKATLTYFQLLSLGFEAQLDKKGP